jgi:hypothetical protein
MIYKVDNKETVTRLDAKKKYRDKYIGYITAQQRITDPENEIIIVVYTADNYDESYEIPAKAENGQFIARMAGLGVGGTEIGGVYFDE